jgi:[ribosomal protein S5]-alanine N-acetyltransferase
MRRASKQESMREKMPFQLRPELGMVASAESIEHPATLSGWQAGLPSLADSVVTLRELRPSDAAPLFAMLATDEVRRYMSPPPGSIEGFERFIAWAQAERAAGRYMCFAVVPAGYDVPVGIFQVRQLDPTFTMGEWGAALGSQFWGTGLFQSGARLLMDFLFEELGLHRLEARAAVQNGRANGAARKIGAVPEGVARQGMTCRGQYHDQLMWSILAEDWRQSKIDERPIVH